MVQSEEVKFFFQGGNEIIIIEDFFVELFKTHDPVKYLKYNLAILREYPEQIYVTYGLGELLRKEYSTLSPIKSDSMIDFGNTQIIRSLLRNEMLLFEYIDILKKKSNDLVIYQNNFLEKYIRSGAFQASVLLKKNNLIQTYKSDKLRKLRDISEVTFPVLKNLLNDKCIDEYNFERFEQFNSVNFSQIFILLWRIVDWAIKDGFQNAKQSIGGDSIDMRYILISCFFDGIFTNEKWMKTCRSDLLTIFSV